MASLTSSTNQDVNVKNIWDFYVHYSDNKNWDLDSYIHVTKNKITVTRNFI